MNQMKFDTRQKVVLVLLILAVIVLLWQGMQFYSNRSTVAPPLAQQTTNNNVGGPNMPGMPANNMAAPTDGAAVNPNSNAQSEYLRLVNEYQVAQMQRMIAEDNEAIAIARRNAAQAMQDTSKLVGGDPGAMTMDNSSPADQNTTDYSLVYTGQQGNGGWTATLKKDGRSYDVIMGGQLPDGSQVSSIDENGVLLMQGNNKKFITFSGVMQANTQASSKMETSGPILKSSQPLLPGQSNANSPQNLAQTTVTANAPSNPPINPSVNTNASPVNVAQSNIRQNPVAPSSATTTTSTTKPVAPTSVAASVPVKSAAIAATTSAAPAQTSAIMAKVDSLVGKFTSKTQPAPAAAKVPATSVAVAPINNYTVQLTEDKNLTSINNFIADHNLGKEAHYYTVYNKHGEKRYVLTYGAYPTADAAQAAMEKLSHTIKEEGTFVIAVDALTKKEKNTNVVKN
jgi:septal ring-binding cell division protein DamX